MSLCVSLMRRINMALEIQSTGRHGHFLHSTCDIGLSDMRRAKNDRDIAFSKLDSTCDIGQWKTISDKDMRHCHFLKLTFDIGGPSLRPPYMLLLPASRAAPSVLLPAAFVSHGRGYHLYIQVLQHGAWSRRQVAQVFTVCQRCMWSS